VQKAEVCRRDKAGFAWQNRWSTVRPGLPQPGIGVLSLGVSGMDAASRSPSFSVRRLKTAVGRVFAVNGFIP
jgi:hypothetical protein